MYKKSLFILVICVMLLGKCSSQFRPLSPCPRIFSYESDEHQWYGRISVSSQYGAALKLNTKFSIKARLPTPYVGRLELLGDRADVLQQVLYKQAVNYQVHFPLLHPLPKLTEIVFNGNVVCTGPPEYADRGEIVTSISLDHVLYLSDTDGAENNDGIFQTNNFNNDHTGLQEIYTGDGGVIYMIQPGIYNPDNFAQPFLTNTIPNKLQNNNYVPHREQKPAEVPHEEQKPFAVPDKEQKPFAVPDEEQKPFAVPDKEQKPLAVPHEEQKPFAVPDEEQKPFILPSVDLGTTKPDLTENIDKNEGNFVTDFNPRPPQKVPTVNESHSSRECGVSARGIENALIIGGEQTVRGDWPWVVAMFVKKPNGLEFVCSGTLISDRHVISAAHCLHQKNNRPTYNNEVILKLGAFNLQDWTDEDARTMAVESISSHPKFDGNLGLKHDIVVITVKQSITFTDFIRPICLWEDDTDLSMVVGKYGTVIGWGRNEFGLIVSAVPNMVRIPIVSTETCKASKQAFHVLTSETTFCAGKKDGTGPCNGDSGGGMYLHHNGRWRMRGVVSASLRDPTSANYCDLSEYVVFTDAAKYSTWMSSVIQE